MLAVEQPEKAAKILGAMNPAVAAAAILASFEDPKSMAPILESLGAARISTLMEALMDQDPSMGAEVTPTHNSP